MVIHLPSLKSRKPSFWLWLVFIFALCGLLALQVLQWRALGDGAADDAIESGRRVVFDLATGEVHSAETPPPAEPDTDAGHEDGIDAPAHEDVGDAGHGHGEAVPDEEHSSVHAEPSEADGHSENHHEEQEKTHKVEEPASVHEDTHGYTGDLSDESAHEDTHALPSTEHSGHEPVTATAHDGHGETHLPAALEEAGNPNLPTWKRYAAPFENPDNKPVIAIVISGLGLSASTTGAALTLPKEITLSFSPYAYDIANWAGQARAEGHEILINLPLEPTDYPISDPGPHALLTSHSPKEITDRLHRILSNVSGYVGVLSPAKEKFTKSEESTEILLRNLKEQGVIMVLGAEGEPIEFADVEQRVRAPVVDVTDPLDDTITRDAIHRKLKEMEEKARTLGQVVLVAHPYPVTIEQISQWAKGLEKRGIRLAPISALMKIGDGEE